MPQRNKMDYKGYYSGTHRSVTPRETLTRVSPMMPAMGITRIANITGLDNIGIPVVMVCRPNSRSVAVSQGKGLDLDAAKASGLMEAVETYHAEAIVQPLKWGSYRELYATHNLVDVTGLPLSRIRQYCEHGQILWMEGRELMLQSSVWVPYEMVHTNYTQPSLSGSGFFPANTNGLASGNHWLEAINHGICEVIERDANTLWRLLPDTSCQATGLDLDTVSDSRCQAVLEKFARAAVQVKVWETTSDVGVATFLCVVMDRHHELLDPELGAGCHPDRCVALLRALTEAAQARTTFIAGSRDDFLAEDYTADTRRNRLAAYHTLLAAHVPKRDFRNVPHWQAETHKDDTEWLLQQLQAVGIQQVIAVDLTRAEFQLPVVRIIIPGLEGPYEGEHSDYVPGRRAKATSQVCL